MTELPKGWAETKLSAVATARMGKTILSKELAASGLPVFSASIGTEPWGYLNESSTMFSRGTLVISARGTIGDVKLPDHEWFVSTQTTIALKPSGAVHPSFLQKQLSAFDWPSVTATTAIPMLTIGKLDEIDVRVPPLAEQGRIVAKLDALIARIDRARADLDRVPALAARYKQAVLASCFTSERPDEMVELGSIVSLENGDRGKNYPSEDEQNEDGYCVFLSTRNVQRGKFDWRDAKFISRDKHDSLLGGTLKNGDIVLTIRGTLGNCAVFDEKAPYENVRINSAMIIVRPIGGILPHYVMWALRSPAFLGWVSLSARGSAQPHLRSADIKSTKVRLPNLEEQAAIVSRVERTFAEIERLAAEAAAGRRLLDQLGQAVLAKALRGELIPQDPADEPASVLLDRIRAEQVATPKVKRARVAAR